MFNRYYPDFEWSNKLWTHNVFRFFGMIFGERYGIRPSIAKITDEYGEIEVAFTLEAQIALFEVYLRNLLTKNFGFKVVILPQIQLAGFGKLGLMPYRFAIAFDNAQSSPGSGTSPYTVAFTCTGSNLALISLAYNGASTADNFTSDLYNGATMTKNQFNNGSAITSVALFTLLAPATGANNSVLSFSSDQAGRQLFVSYTGVDQTTGIDVTGASGAPATTSCAVTIITTVDGCWGTLLCVNGSGAPTASTNINATRVGASTNFIVGDSNGSLGNAGSYILAFGQTLSQNLGTGAVGLRPAAAAGTTLQPRRGMMGIGI